MNSTVQEMSDTRPLTTPVRFRPILAQALAERPVGLALLLLSTFNLVTGLTGISILPCPLMSLAGFPCPGCGLTRACELMLSGQWQLALEMHAFVLFLLPGFLLVSLATLSPDKFRRRILDGLRSLESRTGLVAIILVALVIYWLLRLAMMPEHFLKIVGNDPLLTF